LSKIAAIIGARFLAVKQFLLPSEQSRKVNPKRLIMRSVALLGLFGILGFLVSVSGIIPMKASSGHWAITRWILQFSKNRSIDMHSMGVEVPSLDEPMLVLKGAGHYAIGCAPCHGSPEIRHPRIAQAMLPSPPYLWPESVKREPEELFYIIKHGLKFTGMPAWPVQQRDDEVWAVVAFLRKYPDIDAAEYQRLVKDDTSLKGVEPLTGLMPPTEVPQRILENCAKCHGADGRGRGLGAFPKLAGQTSEYLYTAFEAFARGERHSGIMEPVATGLTSEEIRKLADYYASLPEPSSLYASSDIDPTIKRGEEIAQRGVAGERIPACIACHGPGDVIRNPLYPKLTGQYAEYLTLQLMLFKKGNRGGTSYAHIMRQIAERLTSEQMRDVAMYYESLASAPDEEPQ
jgi:cytochrome c553